MFNHLSSFQHPKFDRWVQVLGVALASFLLWMGNAIALPTDSSAPSQGAQIFQAQCAGCHSGGGNIIRRGKNLKLKTLQKNELDTQEAIVNLVTLGKGIMSSYADRITPEEIEIVSAYVLSQANLDWK